MSFVTEYRNLIEPLQWHAAETPDRVHLVVMEDDRSQSTHTASEIYAALQLAAAQLQQLGVGRDDIVVLAVNHSYELLRTFLGAIGIGAIPSIFPYFAPQMNAQNHAAQIAALVERYDVGLVFAEALLQPHLETALAASDCKVVALAELSRQSVAPLAQLPDFEPEKIAFLQFSSGTTGLKKGVAISHRAIVNQINALSTIGKVTRDDVVISWLPMHHDMGLIGSFLLPLVRGSKTVLMSPFRWIRQPRVLLEEIGTHRASMCYMPNFAFNHTLKSVRSRDIDGLDLSSMRYWLNGSEPIRHETLRLFNKKFGPRGLRRTAIKGAYGMAENTLAITLTPVDEETRIDWIDKDIFLSEQRATPSEPNPFSAIPMAASGVPLPNTEIRIVAEDDSDLGERQIGEIVLRSGSLFDGYFRQQQLTDEVLRDGWFYTGDLGYLESGYLYVTGRKKDLIIVGGKNVYPKDVEDIIYLIPEVKPGRVAVFGVDDVRNASEGVVLVAEVRGQPDEEQQTEIMRRIRQLVTGIFGVRVMDIRFVPRGWIEKSSSGKTARPANRAKYLAQYVERTQPIAA